MFGRGTLFLLVLAAAFLVPYLMSESGETNPVLAWWDSLWTDTADSAYPTATASPIPPAGSLPPGWSHNRIGSAPLHGTYPVGTLQSGQVPPSEWRTVRVLPPGVPHPSAAGVRSNLPSATYSGPIVQNGSDLIRFDLNPDWIVQQWPRVSTHLHDGRLHGMRVAMVSGTGLRDLAGSLTYYFNQQNEMQRLVFDGSTGDPAYLVQDLTNRFQLQRDPELGRDVFVSRSGERLTGWLKVAPAAIVRAAQPYQRYDVQLDLARPGTETRLTSRFIPRRLTAAPK